MEKIFDQTYNYAIITPVKNYCNINNRTKSTNSFSFDIDEIEDIESVPNLTDFIRFDSLQKKKKKIKYFYNDDKVTENMELIPTNKYKKNFYTTKDRHIKQYFVDPFCRMEIKTCKRIIYKNEYKIFIKVIHITKYRNINWKFFKETKSSVCVSFNLKTGNFITIDDNNCFRKNRNGRGTRFRTNNFYRLRKLLKSRVDFYLDDYSSNIVDEKTKNEFRKVFDDDDFIRVVNKELLGSKLPVSFVSSVNYGSDIIFDIIVGNFVKKRGIKVPNDYKELLFCFYPLQKVLKKNDNKLVQSVHDMFKVKSKGTVKYIHENPKINISSFIGMCLLFGEDYYHYVPKIPVKYFTDPNGSIGDKYSVDLYDINYTLNKEEKDNVLHVINSYMEGRTFSNNLDIIIRDHLRMILSLRQYDPDLKFKFRTYHDFNQEHIRLSTLMTKIRKGWTIEYQFEEKMLKDVEADLTAIKDEFSLITFKPYILKRDEDYIEEGSYMHHCVAGYSNKDKSMIISLRTPDKIDRVTCEFDIQSGKCIQARYFTNKTPPDYFLDGLELLKEKIQKYARWGLLNWREKKKVPIKINGIEIVPENTGPRTFQDVLLEDPFFNNF